MASKNENSSDAFTSSSRCLRLLRMTVQRVGSATLNGEDLYYKIESYYMTTVRSTHDYLLVSLLYDILGVRQILETCPPCAKPIT